MKYAYLSKRVEVAVPVDTDENMDVDGVVRTPLRTLEAVERPGTDLKICGNEEGRGYAGA
jgi:hypothetical protein